MTRLRVSATAWRTVMAVAVVALAAGAALLLAGGDSSPSGGAAAAGPKLAWPPPPLRHPQTIHVTAVRAKLDLDPRRDYRIVLTRAPVRVAGGLTISGGHNVVLRGGRVLVPWQGAQPPSGSARRGLFLKGQTGTVHVEGLRLGGDLGDGIDLDERLGATVQLQNIRVDRVTARDNKTFSDTHPDVLQSWAGPKVLRVDRLSAATDYQGFFLLPAQFAKGQTSRIDLRHVDLVGSASSAYLLWRDRASRVRLRDVRLTSPRGRAVYQTMWPSPRWWPGARLSRHAPRTLFASPHAGATYRSPGYR
ncbi:hypothetical protein DSM104299_05723 [Baekduia alba]|uniref:hypothetical protein n=1 Tax=Baekduia alba TaxID=2997333 RepID=UPI002340BDAE|nr:hypothetical protein [Baekduia alba]WCB96953.1 hypothetical protein DSM104299_05723 [Baekduia alba]